MAPGTEPEHLMGKGPERPFSRPRSLLRGVAMFVAGAAVWLALSTVHSLYLGTGVIKTVPPEQPATAHVEDCHRYGPISTSGFGYWWRCRATVDVADGRTVGTTVGHSVLTPADSGRGVAFREACFGDDNTNCAYGRPTNLAWGVVVKILSIVQGGAAISFAFLMVAYLLGTALGKDRANRLIGHRESRS